MTSIVHDICTFAVLCWVTQHFGHFTCVYEGHFMFMFTVVFLEGILSRVEELDRAMANHLRS